MKLANTLLKRSLVFGLFIALVVWLSLLTQKSSQHNQTLTAVNQKLASNEANINYQRVSEKLDELSEQVNFAQDSNSELVKQAQLSEVQDELRNRIEQVSRQFDDTVSHVQLQKLHVDVTTQLATLNEQLAALSAKVIQIQSDAPKAQTLAATKNKSNTLTSTAPFIIQGKELRAGEWVISILSSKQNNIESSVLLTVGQYFDSWQLVKIEESHAVFKFKNQKRRLAIPR